MNLDLNNKTVVITASVNGIGLATAKSLLKEGANVILNGRNEYRLSDAVKKLENEYSGQVFSFLGDMSLETDMKKLVDYIDSTFGKLDILVTNLGSGKPESVNQLEVEEWRKFYNINVLSTVHLLDLLHPFLLKGDNPNVVLISSIVSREVASAPVGYASAKSAIRVLNKYLSELWSQDGIRVNCVLPGNIYFEGGRWQELLNKNKDGVLEYIEKTVSMKRFGQPSEIADTIAFLASVRSSFTTGAEIVIDGGQLRAI